MQTATIDTVSRVQYDALKHEIVDLRRQLDWLRRQVFGQKSEKRLVGAGAKQAVLGEGFLAIPEVAPLNKKSRIEAHEREYKPKVPTGDESALFFDDKVPLEEAIVGLYAVEKEIRDQELDDEAKLERRQAKAKPIAERFFK